MHESLILKFYDSKGQQPEIVAEWVRKRSLAPADLYFQKMRLFMMLQTLKVILI